MKNKADKVCDYKVATRGNTIEFENVFKNSRAPLFSHKIHGMKERSNKEKRKEKQK